MENRSFSRKRVDLMIGLDFALLSAKHQITHAAVVTGDSDCCCRRSRRHNERVSWCVSSMGRNQRTPVTCDHWLTSASR